MGPIAGVLETRLHLGLASTFVVLTFASIVILLVYEEPMHRLIRGESLYRTRAPAPVAAE